MITLDPQSDLVQEYPATVYTPTQKRTRFPENCVKVMASIEEAEQKASKEENQHAAIVLGPARSSEGFRLYYLIRWL